MANQYIWIYSCLLQYNVGDYLKHEDHEVSIRSLPVVVLPQLSVIQEQVGPNTREKPAKNGRFTSLKQKNTGPTESDVVTRYGG